MVACSSLCRKGGLAKIQELFIKAALASTEIFSLVIKRLSAEKGMALSLHDLISVRAKIQYSLKLCSISLYAEFALGEVLP